MEEIVESDNVQEGILSYCSTLIDSESPSEEFICDVYCKIELPKVADGNWRMLHLQIGESCKTFAKSSQERCSA